jgi:hypothetical protein
MQPKTACYPRIMVHRRVGTPRGGIFVVGLFALAAIDACGSRSPLDERFHEGDGETGGSGGSVVSSGGVGGNGVGVGGSNPTGGGGAGYPMGAGGSSPMSTGGASPSAGYGGNAVSVGGAYPGAGGGYPAAGYGGNGMGVGGAIATGGVGGKGNGGGGKGGGTIYKGCLPVCQKYDAYCGGPDSTCLADCSALGATYPECSLDLGNYLACLNQAFRPLGTCDPGSCSGAGCLEEAEVRCESELKAFTDCANGFEGCITEGQASETTCRLTSSCGPNVYDTYCEVIDATGTAFKCSCFSADTSFSDALTDRNLSEVCYEMADICGFPSGR